MSIFCEFADSILPSIVGTCLTTASYGEINSTCMLTGGRLAGEPHSVGAFGYVKKGMETAVGVQISGRLLVGVFEIAFERWFNVGSGA